MLTRLAAITLGTLLLLANGCAPKGCATDDLKIVFSDFAYIGVFAAGRGHPTADSDDVDH